MIQEIVFGTGKLKFDSAEVKEVPQAILTCKYSHAIAAYLKSCSESGYEALSKSSLWRILHELKPSQQKSLAGLDDTLTTGINGSQMLLDHAKKSPQSEKTTKALEKGKCYLKTKYPLNCTNDSPVKTHNINFALSDLKNKKLQVPSEQVMDETCKDCVELWEAIDAVRVMGEASESLEVQYDIKTAIEDIKLYVNHLIRDVQQKKAKAFAFNSLDEASCFWLKDYCQKILPMKFREGQIDYFGKKGMTLHVDIIFTMLNMKLQKNIYFTSMQTADQDAKDVLVLADNILKKLPWSRSTVRTLQKLWH